MGMMARYTGADVVVVGLIGERGREVKEFIERTLGAEGLAKAVVLAAPANELALMRLHGAYRAVAIAEYFRDRGQHVLLLMDSLTRFAMAQREIGIAVGELPSSRGYPPSVFGRIASLVERAGNGDSGRGSITALLYRSGRERRSERSDRRRRALDSRRPFDVVAEKCRARALSGDRCRRLGQPRDADHRSARSPPPRNRFKQLYGRLEESRDMIAIGGYRAGNDAELDRAVQRRAAMENFLRQDMAVAVGLEDSVAELGLAVGE